MTFVLDASATVPFLFEDEADAASEAILDRIADSSAVVPAVWHLEAANMLRTAERRRRLDAAQVTRAAGLLDALRLATDDADPAALRGRALDLSRRHGLTAYDATYLDLAMRRGLPLATRDGDLRRAAEASGVALLDA